MDSAPFTTTQARQRGYTPAHIRRLVACREWTVLRRGVYVETVVMEAATRVPGRRHALDVAALLLSLDYDAVAAGASAVRIWNLDTLQPPADEVVVATDQPGIVSRRRGDYVVHAATLPPAHRAHRHGVAVTSAARTVVDIARTSRFVDGVVVADSALHRRLTTPRELTAILADCAGWPGIARARRVVAFADAASESALESISRVAMAQQGVPAPRTQVTLGDHIGFGARVDFLWPEQKVIGEADGLGKYEASGGRSTREIVRAEKRREERLADAGYEIIRWGWEDARRPGRLGFRLRAALARGAERQRGRLAG